ncbi:hypothetical protein QZH41_014898, partial [Actinostola sp. cb2023]
MADVLEVDVDRAEFFDDEGEDDVQRVKLGAKKRKGRGFTGKKVVKSSESSSKTDDSYDALEAGQEGQSGPARSFLFFKFPAVEGWILFITNVHEEAQEDDLHELFSDYGEIKNLHVNLDRRTGFLKGYALVEYETFKEAQCALEGLNGTQMLEQTISVAWAFVKGP